jgi:hypothetical protein
LSISMLVGHWDDLELEGHHTSRIEFRATPVSTHSVG